MCGGCYATTISHAGEDRSHSTLLAKGSSRVAPVVNLSEAHALVSVVGGGQLLVTSIIRSSIASHQQRSDD